MPGDHFRCVLSRLCFLFDIAMFTRVLYRPQKRHSCLSRFDPTLPEYRRGEALTLLDNNCSPLLQALQGQLRAMFRLLSRSGFRIFEQLLQKECCSPSGLPTNKLIPSSRSPKKIGGNQNFSSKSQVGPIVFRGHGLNQEAHFGRRRRCSQPQITIQSNILLRFHRAVLLPHFAISFVENSVCVCDR